MTGYPQRELAGWEVFNDDTWPEIQAIDEPERDRAVVLESDLHAVRACLQAALRGEDYALSALDEIGFEPSVFGDSGVMALRNASVAVGMAIGDSPSGGIPVEEVLAMLHESRLYMDHALSDAEEPDDHSSQKEDARNALLA